MTVKMDITKIIKRKQKLYPTMLYYITTVVNKYDELKMAIDENGKLGMFETMIPSYTIFHQDTKKLFLIFGQSIIINMKIFVERMKMICLSMQIKMECL